MRGVEVRGGGKAEVRRHRNESGNEHVVNVNLFAFSYTVPAL